MHFEYKILALLLFSENIFYEKIHQVCKKDKKFRKSRDGGITSAGLISSGGGD